MYLRFIYPKGSLFFEITPTIFFLYTFPNLATQDENSYISNSTSKLQALSHTSSYTFAIISLVINSNRIKINIPVPLAKFHEITYDING